jgi:hypothetical protein
MIGRKNRATLSGPSSACVSHTFLSALMHIFFQLNMQGSQCMLNPRVVQTKVGVQTLSFLSRAKFAP